MFANMVGLAPRGRIDEALYEDTAAQAEALARFRSRAVFCGWREADAPASRAPRRNARLPRRSGAWQPQQRRVVTQPSRSRLYTHALRSTFTQKRKAEEEAGGAAGGDDAPAAERDKEKGAAKREKAPSGPIYYRVTVKDNGKGMAHEDIPNMLGRVLSGTKYGVRQARGKFGLGAKMALIWAKQTTGQPITVRSAKPGQSFISAYTLDLDLRTNAPHIHAESKEANPEQWHGSQVSVLIRGAWSTYGSRIVKYLRQLAVITPYAQLTFKYASEGGGRADMSLRFRRRTEHMPPPPAETAYHPSAVDLETIRALMRNTACKTMRTFLCRGACLRCLCAWFALTRRHRPQSLRASMPRWLTGCWRSAATRSQRLATQRCSIRRRSWRCTACSPPPSLSRPAPTVCRPPASTTCAWAS